MIIITVIALLVLGFIGKVLWESYLIAMERIQIIKEQKELLDDIKKYNEVMEAYKQRKLERERI